MFLKLGQATVRIKSRVLIRSFIRSKATKKITAPPNPELLNYLAQRLDLPHESINRLLVKKPALQKTDEGTTCKTMEVLKKYGFGRSSIQEYPDLLVLPPFAVENYILILKESGFVDIRPFMLITYPDLSRKSVTVLKGAGFIESTCDLLESYSSILKLSKESRDSISSVLPDKYEQVSLLELRVTVMRQFLADSLETSVDSIGKLMLRYPRTKHRSFGWTVDNLRILQQHFKFEKEKILKHGYLFQSSPQNSMALLEDVKTLGGRSIVELVRLRPKVIMSTPDTLAEIETLFDEHGISAEARSKYPEIYTLAVATIRKRLEALDSVPELIPLKTHPRVTRVLYYFNKTKKRLDYLQSIQVTGVSLHSLTTDTERFSKFIELGEMKNKGTDVVYFLSNYLGLSKKEVRATLMVHPHWLQIPPIYAKEVVQFLHQTRGLSLKQIIVALPIVLYPLDKIASEMDRVKACGEAAETDDFFLNMVLYFIERAVHFTGDGIWTHHHLARLDQAEQEQEEPHEDETISVPP